MVTPKKVRERVAFDRERAADFEIFLEDLRGMVWNSSRAHDLTWTQLAIRANVTLPTVSKFAYGETKRPTFPTVFGIARAIGARLRIAKA